MKSFFSSTLMAVLVSILIWVCPVPEGLKPEAWQMFSIFMGTILLVVLDAMPMGSATLLGLCAMVATHTTGFETAFAGYASEVVWLVLTAFFIAHGFVHTGLAQRIAYIFVELTGRHSLGLAYGLCIAETCLAPAIPSVTARSGAIIFPIAQSLSETFGSRADDGTAGKLGRFLMLVAFQASTVTSAMFLTAMAGNPLLAKLAQVVGVNLSWSNWGLGALVPGLVSLALIPLVIYWLQPPGIKKTPDAPRIARQKLHDMGPLSRDERVLLITFVGLLVLWVFGNQFHVHAATAALLGFSVLILTGVLKWKDLLGVKAAFDTFVWFGAFIGMADAMNRLGLTTWFADNASSVLNGLPMMLGLLILVLVYFYTHYFFASSTAHIGALYLPFLGTALQLGAPPMVMALLLGYLSNLFGGLTHYGFGSAPILFGGGFVPLKTWWNVGFWVSVFNLIIWLGVGSFWWAWLY